MIAIKEICGIMANNPNHHLAIHGHFYQPPRENPWLGVIEEQDTAQPFTDWNSKICAECYTPLTCSPIFDESNKAKDLFNCYAHISYNFGPTLISWMDKYSPFTLERLQVADGISRNAYNGHGSAIAQVYNHQILPLSDAADRHTQILWGLKEFYYRFGRAPASMWLSETAVDMNTIRSLIDHNIKYIILSPLQASFIRSFGEFEWTGVPDGSIDTRVPYRVFEVDGAGRTHFDRYIDVIFYDKEISTKISFEHLLSDTDRLEWLIRERYNEEATLPQLVLIATDGEIYGHHEKNGNRALAKTLDKMLSTGICSITNLEKFIKENQPYQEVKLWEGIDGEGSSWSCEHGIGRWHRDCGCSDGPHYYNQEWREHLRNAFDELRYNIRHICTSVCGDFLYDYFDARNDYISVILDPSIENKKKFLERHCSVVLSEKGKVKLWKLLEADRNSMLMYTSCAWFFSDISGCEAQQNMRYALRAAELAEDYSDYDLVRLLQERLRKAKSNFVNMGTGEDVFTNHILNSSYNYKAISAIHAILKLYQLPEPEYNTSISMSHIVTSENKHIKYIIASVTCKDKLTNETHEVSLFGFTAFETLDCGVCFTEDLSSAKEMSKLSVSDLNILLENDGFSLSSFPYDQRKKVTSLLLKSALKEADQSLHEFYNSHKPIFEYLTSNNLPVPNHLKAIGEEALSYRLTQCVTSEIERGGLCHRCINEVNSINTEAAKYGLAVNKEDASRIIAKQMSDRLVMLLSDLTENAVEEVLSLLIFIQDNDFWLENWDELLDRYWRILHLPPRPTPATRKIVDDMRAIGSRLFFSDETIKHLTQVLFSTPV